MNCVGNASPRGCPDIPDEAARGGGAGPPLPGSPPGHPTAGRALARARYAPHLPLSLSLSLARRWRRLTASPRTSLTRECRRLAEELADKLQGVIQSPEFGGRAFVKISTRSPKDVVFHLPKFEPTLRRVTEEWTALYNLPGTQRKNEHAHRTRTRTRTAILHTHTR